MNRIHLICNAHIDPVWQWEWEEGAATAVSTFRSAATLCEEFDGFIFNHNEAILYQWIEEYEPTLFKKIQSLVKQGKWIIIGGWYLQPDCNMPCGESFVRQMLYGKNYFFEKFGVETSTAVNFDSFGHTRGLVQIMNKAGYQNYLIWRPDSKTAGVPANDFLWVGYDGSEILIHKMPIGYNSSLGHVDKKIAEWIDGNRDKKLTLLAWGVGNHGGGPSREDLRIIEKMMGQSEEFELVHSTPDTYFNEVRDSGEKLERFAKGLNPCFVGCYTSMIKIKQRHRQLENQLYSAEKMLSAADSQGLLEYPKADLAEAFKDLMTAEFHDILPGSSIQKAEEASLRLLNHGLEIVSRLKARAFFALAAGQPAAKEGEYPILVYNPHPYSVKGIIECEFMLADPNWAESFALPVVFCEGKKLPTQAEKESSNINLDWRKKVAFEAELKPSCMNRFDCKIEMAPHRPEATLKEEDGKIAFRTKDMEVLINCRTGLIDAYRVNGRDFLKKDAWLPLVIDDNEDPWRMDTNSLRRVAGSFKLMTEEESARFSGVRANKLSAVRVVEDGEARSVVEAVLRYGDSCICVQYRLPKKGTELNVHVRVLWNEKAKMLKLSVPTVFERANYIGQTAYGHEELPGNGSEAVSQKWSGVFDEKKNAALTVVNDGIYGSDFLDGEIRLSLLRSPVYCAHPIFDREIIPQDRFSLHMDQGEAQYEFWLNAGEASERIDSISREAMVHNEKPFTLSFFPSGEGQKPLPLMAMSDGAVEMTTFKKCEVLNDYIIRLFEPTGKDGRTTISILDGKIKKEIQLSAFEIKSLRANMKTGTLCETSLLER